MLGAGDGKTSGGYVALEKISGTLGGRKGSFVMIHRALMVDRDLINVGSPLKRFLQKQ